MALTPLRWAAAAIAGCFILFYAVMGGVDYVTRGHSAAPRDSVRYRLATRAYTEQRRANALANRYRIAQLLDSTRGERARASAPSPVIRAFYDAAIPREVRAELESLVARATGQATESAKVGVDVYFVYDTSRYVRAMLRNSVYGPEARYQLPTSAGERCGVLVRIGRDPSLWSVTRSLRTQAAADQLLGPCAYYRAFGMPGPRVGDWLTRGGWTLGVDGSWTRSPGPVQSNWPQNKYFPGPSSALATLAIPGVRCARGELERCEAEVLASAAESPVLRWNASIVTRSVRLGPRYYRYGGNGLRGSEMLAAMVRTLGRDRFQKFWTSGESLPTAFQHAAGESLGSWVSRWMVEQYGAVEAGPRVGGFALIASLLIVVLSGFLALRANARRQFA